MVLWKHLEYYAPIKDLYEISNNGTIRNKKTGKNLTPYIDRDGYVHITLSTLVNGKSTPRHYPIHRLVAFNYVEENRSPELTVNHDDDNKLNNHESNLSWMSISDNVKLAYKTGANVVNIARLPESKGILNGRSLLDEETVIIICEMIKNGKSNKDIFSLLQDSLTNIQMVERIKKKAAWVHISDLYFSVKKVKGKRNLIVIPV